MTMRIIKISPDRKFLEEIEQDAYINHGTLTIPVNFQTFFTQNGSYEIDLPDWGGCEYAPYDMPSKGHLQAWVGGQFIRLHYAAEGRAVEMHNLGGIETPVFNPDGSIQTDNAGNAITRLTDEGEFPAFWTPLVTQTATEFDLNGDQLLPIVKTDAGKVSGLEFRKIFRGAESRGLFPFNTVEGGIPQITEDTTQSVLSGITAWDIDDWAAISDAPAGWTGQGYLQIAYFNGHAFFEATHRATGQVMFCVKPNDRFKGEWWGDLSMFFNKQEVLDILRNYATLDHTHDQYLNREIFYETIQNYQSIGWRPTVADVTGLRSELDNYLHKNTFNGQRAGYLLGANNEGKPQFFDMSYPHINVFRLPRAKEGTPYPAFNIGANEIWLPETVQDLSITMVCVKDWVVASWTLGGGIVISSNGANVPDSEDVTIYAVFQYRLSPTGKQHVFKVPLLLEVLPSAVTITAPNAPTGLTATAISSSQIDLAWTDNANNENVYEIWRRKTSVGGAYLKIATLSANATAYQDTGLEAATGYDYQVKAINVAGEGTASGSATTQAATETGGLYARYFNTTNLDEASATVAYERVDSTVNFSWNGGAPIEGVAGTNFSARWSGYFTAHRDGNIVFSVIASGGVVLWMNQVAWIDDWGYTSTPKNRTFTIVNAVKGARYYIVLEFRTNAASPSIVFRYEEPAGNAVTVPQGRLTPLAADGARIDTPVLSGLALSETSCRLDWSISGNLDSFGIVGGTDPNSLPGLLAITGSLRTVTYDGLLARAKLYFRIRGILKGRRGAWSNLLEVQLKQDALDPNAPQPILVERLNGDTIKATFTDTNEGIEQYSVQYKVKNTNTWKTLKIDAQTNRYFLGDGEDEYVLVAGGLTSTSDFTLTDAFFRDAQIEVRARTRQNNRWSAWSSVYEESAQPTVRVVNRSTTKVVPHIPYYMDFNSFATSRIKSEIDLFKRLKFKEFGITFSWFKVWTNFTTPEAFDPNNLQFDFREIREMINYAHKENMPITCLRLDAGFNDFTLANAGVGQNNTLKTAWLPYLYTNAGGQVIGLRIDDTNSPPWQLYKRFIEVFQQQFDNYFKTGFIRFIEAGIEINQEVQPHYEAVELTPPNNEQYNQRSDQLATVNDAIRLAFGDWARYGYGGYDGDCVVNVGGLADELAVTGTRNTLDMQKYLRMYRGFRVNLGDTFSPEQCDTLECLAYSWTWQREKEEGAMHNYYGVEYFFIGKWLNADVMAQDILRSFRNGALFAGVIVAGALSDMEQRLTALKRALDANGAWDMPRQYPAINLATPIKLPIAEILQNGGITAIIPGRSLTDIYMRNLADMGKKPMMLIERSANALPVCGFGMESWAILAVSHQSNQFYQLAFNSANVNPLQYDIYKGSELVLKGQVTPTSGTVTINLSNLTQNGEYEIEGYSSGCRGRSNRLKFNVIHNGAALLSLPQPVTLARISTNSVRVRVSNTNSGLEQYILQFQNPQNSETGWLYYMPGGTFHPTNEAGAQRFDEGSDAQSTLDIVLEGVYFTGAPLKVRAKAVRGEQLSAWTTEAVESGTITPPSADTYPDFESISDWQNTTLRVKTSHANGTLMRVRVRLGIITIADQSNITHNGTFSEITFPTFLSGNDLRGNTLTVLVNPVSNAGDLSTKTYFLPQTPYREYRPAYEEGLHEDDKMFVPRLTKTFGGQYNITDIGQNSYYGQNYVVDYYVNGANRGSVRTLRANNLKPEKMYTLLKVLKPDVGNEVWRIGTNYHSNPIMLWIQVRPWAEMGINQRMLWPDDKAIGKPTHFRDGLVIPQGQPTIKKYNIAFEGVLSGVTEQELKNVHWDTDRRDLPFWLYSPEIGQIVRGLGYGPQGGNLKQWPIGGEQMTRLGDAFISIMGDQNSNYLITDWEPHYDDNGRPVGVEGWEWDNEAHDAIAWMQDYIYSRSGREYFDWFSPFSFTYLNMKFSVISNEGYFSNSGAYYTDGSGQYTQNATHWEQVWNNLGSINFPKTKFIRAGMGYNVVTKFLDLSYPLGTEERYLEVPYFLYSQMVLNLIAVVSPDTKVLWVHWAAEDMKNERDHVNTHRIAPYEGFGYFRGNDIRYVYTQCLIEDLYFFVLLTSNVELLHAWTTFLSADPKSVSYYSTVGAAEPHVYRYEGQGNPPVPAYPASYLGMEGQKWEAMIEAMRRYKVGEFDSVCDGINNELDFNNAFEWRLNGGSWQTVANSNGNEHLLAWKHKRPYCTKWRRKDNNSKTVRFFQYYFANHDDIVEVRFTEGGVLQTRTLDANRAHVEKFG